MKRMVLAAGLTFAVATTILAQAGNPPAPPAAGTAVSKPAASSEVLRKLSRRERKEKTAALDAQYQDFLTDAAPIILPNEIDAFLGLRTNAERDVFILDFWHRRDVMNGTANGAFREMYARRLQVARERFRSLSSDRSKMFLLHGAPVAVVHTECARLLQPIEVWKYDEVPGFGQNVRFLFYKPRYQNDYRLWNPMGGSMAMADLLASDSLGANSTDEASGRRALSESSSPYSYISRIQLECGEADEILRAITQMVQSRVDLLKVYEPPESTTEDVRRLLRSVVVADPNAPKLPATMTVAYPGKDGSRTDVQMTLLVPRSEIVPSEVGGTEVYTLDVTGEVLKEGEVWEKYRYRFDFPGDYKGESLPLVVDRLLRPAEYVSRIKVIDVSGGAEAIVENTISVPEIFSPEPAPQAEEKEPPAAATAVEAQSASKPRAPQETRLRIVPPSDEIVSGVQTIETIASGDAIRGVEFWLDGRKIAVRRAPPFSLDLDFGTVPQTRRIRAIALDAKNTPLTGDELVVNSGTDPFRVRITSPRIAPHLSGATRVEMEVHVPDSEELKTLELFWNETRLATLFDPPFIQTVQIPETEGVGYLRAVATLQDPDYAPVEDVVMINSPAYMEELNVHLIELPTTVLVGGKPATGLTEASFKILDEGKPVPLAKFEYVRNLPLSVGVAVDTSGSMQPRMDEAQKAAAQFFQNVMKKGDKGLVVAFDAQPRVMQKWSAHLGDLQAGLARLRAEESTALYDAVVYSLYNFLGIRGQKALIVITDGKDTASKFTFDQAVEYARRAAVPIYGIGIGIKGNEMDVRYKLSKLCSETGGAAYYIEQARELQRIYAEVQAELRSQYVLGFYPPADVKTGKWRDVQVQVTQGKARTISGYYP